MVQAPDGRMSQQGSPMIARGARRPRCPAGGWLLQQLVQVPWMVQALVMALTVAWALRFLAEEAWPRERWGSPPSYWECAAAWLFFMAAMEVVWYLGDRVWAVARWWRQHQRQGTADA